MGILDKLLGRKPEQAGADRGAIWGPAAVPAPTPPLDDRYLWIGNILYETSRSPNGRWTLGWSDATPDGSRGGHRGGGKGAWVLIEGGQIRAQGRLERPNDGIVADNGRFVLPDWLFTDQLAGRLYAFEPDGTVIIDELLGANIGAATITTDGRLALAETLVNPGNSAWSNQLACWDLDARTRRWMSRMPAVVRRIELDPDGTRVHVHLSSDRVQEILLADGSLGAYTKEPGSDNFWVDYQELEDEVKAGIETADAATLAGWLARADALRPKFKEYPNWQAKVLRVRGEVCEKAGRNADAIAAYSAGLALDPNLGVKRRLKALGVESPTAVPRKEPAAPSPAADDRLYASSACPSCGVELNPLPKAKSKCKGCGQPIWVRGGPDAMRHLLREDQLEAHEARWAEAYEAQEREKQLAGERQREADRAAGLIVGLYDVDVVGESNYQEALRRHAGAVGEWGAETSVVVELVREPDNRYDRNAVSVRIDGAIVGYLPREEAALVGPMLKALERGRPCRARATIRGGSDGAPLFGITIDGVPDPYEHGGR